MMHEEQEEFGYFQIRVPQSGSRDALDYVLNGNNNEINIVPVS